MPKIQLPCPARARHIRTCTFGWIDHRFLANAFLSQLSADALRLYVFLVLVANAAGVSWYSYDRICARLQIDVERYVVARNELLRQSLIAYENGVFQVLSLPARAPQHETVSSSPPETLRHGDWQALKNVLVNASLKSENTL